MKKLISLILCVLMTIPLFIGCGKSGDTNQSGTSNTFSVGYGSADISPKESVKLSGFGDHEERYSSKVSEALLTTCIAITGDDGETVLVLANDLLNSVESWVKPIRERISKETGVPFDHIMFHSSHTHSAPHIGQYPVYQEQVKQQALIAAKQAMEDRAPATLHGSFMRVEERLNCNRHYLLSDGTYMGEGVGAVPKDQIIGHFTNPDNLLQVVKFERGDKKDIVMINWQAHYLGSKLDYTACTSDYPGVARMTVEQALDCHSIFIVGASGNMNSWSQLDDMDVTYHTELGQILGNKVISMVDQMQPLSAGKVQITEVMQPCRSIATKGDMIEIPIYALSFGDVGMIFAPYEMFDTNAKAVRDQSPFPMTFVASCSNASYSYIPTPPSWDWEHKYEVRVTKFEKGTAEELQQKFVDMLTEQFSTAGYAPIEKGEGYITPEFVPFTDDVTYINPSVGDMSACTEVENGFYHFYLLKGTSLKSMLTRDKALAEEILQKETVKLMFDESNVVVGIAS